jgi:hypothetical protein
VPDSQDEDGLFAEDAVERVEVPQAPKLPVEKTFRPFDPDQVLLLPPSLDDWLPAEHLARFVAELVDEHLDLSRIRAAFTEGRGAPPFDPRLMVRLLIYGYTTGVRPRGRSSGVASMTSRSAGSLRGLRRTTGRSPGSASGTCRRWRSCSCRP